MITKLTAIGLLFLAGRFPLMVQGQEGSTTVNARAQQVIALVGSPDPNATARLNQALADDHWYVRGVAAGVLARRPDKSEAARLLPLIRDPNWFVRDEAVAALRALAGPVDSGDIIALLTSADAYARARAASTLGSLNNTAATVQLIKLLADNEEVVRRSAARALGEIKASTAVPALMELLKDEDSAVRKASAIALGRIGDARATAAIREAQKNAREEDWEYAAALYRLGDREQLERVAVGLASEYADARLGTVQTLMEFADTRSLPALLRLAKPLKTAQQDPSASEKPEAFQIRLLLARGLAAFDSEQARVGLLALLEDAEPEVRASSSQSLAKSIRAFPNADASTRSLAGLVGALKKEDSPLAVDAMISSLSAFDRIAAADALLEARGDGKANANIARALGAVDVTTDSQLASLTAGSLSDRKRAVDTLARLGDPKAVTPLIETLATSKEPQLKVTIAEALGRLRDRRAVDSLIAASRAREREVKVAAITSLGSIGDHTAAEPLFVSARDEDRQVRDAAIRSLAALGISVDRVAADLSAPNWQIRAAALTTLARLGDATAVPLAISSLKDSDARVRSEAARTVGVLGDPRALNPLIASLGDPAAEVRVEATFALGNLKDPRSIGPLTGLLNDRDSQVSLAAAEALARMREPKATRVLIGSLSAEDSRVRSRAAQVLARVSAEGPLDEGVRPLAQALRDRDPVVRYHVADALIAQGSVAVPSVIEVLRSPREADRERAARVLWRIGSPSVDSLIVVLQEKGTTPEMRASAAYALGVIGDKRAIKSLTSLLRDERYFVRLQAARALSQMGDAALDQLLEMSNSSTPSTREAAVEALGSGGSSRALDRVIDALSDSNSNVRAAAVRALGESASERGVAPLLTLMRDESSTLRAQASVSLARLGPVALPKLVAALRDSKPSVRQLAAEALGEIGSREAVAPLVELIETDTSGARLEAITALGKIGDPAAIDPILSLHRSGSVAVRRKTIPALARFRDKRAVEVLTAALADQNEEVRQSAAAGLGEVGDQGAVSQLERLADKDPSQDVRAAAAQAIQRIRAQELPRKKAENPPKQ
jgi:HEAT repeat protein